MKTAEEILESHLTSMLSRTKDSYVTIDEMKQVPEWEACVKAIEQAQKEAYHEGQSSPKIRQLEWEDTDMWYFKAKTSLGLGYSIIEVKGTYIVHFGDAPISWEKSLESAKAAAQEHFEKRVKECLE